METAGSGSGTRWASLSIGSAASRQRLRFGRLATCGGGTNGTEAGSGSAAATGALLAGGQRFDATAKCGDLGARRQRLEEADDTQEPAGDQDQHEQNRELFHVQGSRCDSRQCAMLNQPTDARRGSLRQSILVPCDLRTRRLPHQGNPVRQSNPRKSERVVNIMVLLSRMRSCRARLTRLRSRARLGLPVSKEICALALLVAWLLGAGQALAQTAYIVSSASGIVSAIDTARSAVIATISVAGNPVAIAVTPDGRKVYVASDYSHTVSVISAASNEVISRIALGRYPRGVAITPDGAKVYVANSGSVDVSVIDTVIDTASDSVIATVALGHMDFANLSVPVITPDGAKVYIANQQTNNVSVIGTASDTVIGTIAVGNWPGRVIVIPDGSKLYVANFGEDTVSVIATASDTVIATIPIRYGPGKMLATPSGNKVYVANVPGGPASSRHVSVIDTASDKVIATIPARDPDIAVTLEHHDLARRAQRGAGRHFKRPSERLNDRPRGSVSFWHDMECTREGGPMNETLRRAALDEAPEIGRIRYEAFGAVNDAHNFPPDFPPSDRRRGDPNADRSSRFLRRGCRKERQDHRQQFHG